MIRIHIRRRVPEDKQPALMALINQMRSAIVGNPGYPSSETLKRIYPPGEVLVVSKWQSLFYWRQWYESSGRVLIQGQIDELLGSETRYEIYEYE